MSYDDDNSADAYDKTGAVRPPAETKPEAREPGAETGTGTTRASLHDRIRQAVTFAKVPPDADLLLGYLDGDPRPTRDEIRVALVALGLAGVAAATTPEVLPGATTALRAEVAELTAKLREVRDERDSFEVCILATASRLLGAHHEAGTLDASGVRAVLNDAVTSHLRANKSDRTLLSALTAILAEHVRDEGAVETLTRIVAERDAAQERNRFADDAVALASERARLFGEVERLVREDAPNIRSADVPAAVRVYVAREPSSAPAAMDVVLRKAELLDAIDRLLANVSREWSGGPAVATCDLPAVVSWLVERHHGNVPAHEPDPDEPAYHRALYALIVGNDYDYPAEAPSALMLLQAWGERERGVSRG